MILSAGISARGVGVERWVLSRLANSDFFFGSVICIWFWIRILSAAVLFGG